MVEFGLDGIQADFDVAQTLSIGQLGESHAQELIEAREVPGTKVSFVPANAPVEIALGQRVQKLGKQILPGVHRQVLSTGFRGKVYGFAGEEAEIDTDEN